MLLLEMFLLLEAIIRPALSSIFYSYIKIKHVNHISGPPQIIALNIEEIYQMEMRATYFKVSIWEKYKINKTEYLFEIIRIIQLQKFLSITSKMYLCVGNIKKYNSSYVYLVMLPGTLKTNSFVSQSPASSSHSSPFKFRLKIVTL